LINACIELGEELAKVNANRDTLTALKKEIFAEAHQVLASNRDGTSVAAVSKL